MDKTSKVLLGLGAIGGLVGIALALSKKSSDEEGSSQIVLKIYDQHGNLVVGGMPDGIAAALPGTLTEGGGPYIAEITIVNGSVYTGTTTPAPYTFVVNVNIMCGVTTLLSVIGESHYVAAGATAKYAWTFNIGYGVSGRGTSVANIMDVNGYVLAATPQATFNVAGASITGAGAVTLDSVPSLSEGGGPYTITATIKNNSTYPDGSGAPYTFNISAAVAVSTLGQPGTIIFRTMGNEPHLVPANGMLRVSWSLSVPYGVSGGGTAHVQIVTTAGDILDSDDKAFTVAPAGVTPGGTISF